MADAPLPEYSADQFRTAKRPCDIIMKGGVTSGVVYPYTILELATRYRFQSIGGTSAGAIAAALTAAAEFARRNGDPGGFCRLQTHCNELPGILRSLFQVDHDLRPAVRAAEQLAAAKGPPFAWIALPALIGALLLGAALFLLFRALGAAGDALIAAIVIGLVAGALVGAVAGLWTKFRLLKAAVESIPKRNFGLCSGLTQDGITQSALTDWLHDAIQHIAFGEAGKDKPPLTFGDLEGLPDPIHLRMVTTNLSLRRPHMLPRVQLPRASFRMSEWREYFPDAVLNFLAKGSKDAAADRIRFPHERQLPVVVATRLSLSFPLLFKAVPIHALDLGSAEATERLTGTESRAKLVRMWLSDGGLSSNFPVQLFDAPLPRWPTFAISLDDLPHDAAGAETRATIPRKAREGFHVPAKPIEGLGGLFWQLFAAAKDWQDTMQSNLLGQRERVVRIYLDEGEGGLALDMDKARIEQLMGFGLQAGKLLGGDAFNFDEHRHRRTIAFYETTAAWLERARRAWTDDFANWFRGYRAEAFKLSADQRAAVASRIDSYLEAVSSPEEAARPKPYSKTSGRLRITPNLEPETRPMPVPTAPTPPNGP